MTEPKKSPRKKPAVKSTVTAKLTKSGTWTWEWKSPNGTPYFGVGFATKQAALAAGRVKERELRRLSVIDPGDSDD